MSLLILVRPLVQQDWPLPAQSSTWQQADIVRNNVLLSTVTNPVPKNQYDWPVPRPYERAQDLNTWIQSSVRLLLLNKPFNQLDWPVPRPYERAQDLNTWVRGPNLNLIGKDTLTAGRQYTELPPQPPQRPNNLYTWIQTLNLPVITTPGVPTSQHDWPLPLGHFQQREDYFYFWKPVARSLAPPFRQTEWPTPRDHIQPDRSYYFTFPRTLVGADKLPFRQMDWPLTPAYPYDKAAIEFISTFKLLTNIVTKSASLSENVTVNDVWSAQAPVPSGIGQQPIIRDWWDRNEWGDFHPGWGIRK
ncbi:MAG TPA: hypothetical protein VFV92_01035 [Candidatus Bathyarchaeia archaeon]|nr:hypothetical protein [Candidatus Bathyarchaeia archaeon]